MLVYRESSDCCGPHPTLVDAASAAQKIGYAPSASQGAATRMTARLALTKTTKLAEESSKARQPTTIATNNPCSTGMRPSAPKIGYAPSASQGAATRMTAR